MSLISEKLRLFSTSGGRAAGSSLSVPSPTSGSSVR
jgi:hypothetical protein